jgi:FtsP/CotA-like multicopper oxidase with cupredoxin domain
MLDRVEKVKLSRRDMLKLSGAGAGLFALTASGLSVPRGVASGGSLYVEAFPTSPLIMDPFRDIDSNQLPIPKALRPMESSVLTGLQGKGEDPYDPHHQDCHADPTKPVTSGGYWDSYKQSLGSHQICHGDPVPPTPDGKQFQWLGDKPVVYQLKMEVNKHDFTGSQVQPINSAGQNVLAPNGKGAQYLPSSTIYGFNGTFPGPRINATYHRGSMVRFENHLDENPLYLDRQDFGAPNNSFLTHLHNGHTAPESDGQPHYSYHRFTSLGDSDRAADIDSRGKHYRAAWEPGEWVNQLYLGYPAGGDDREKQSFFWFHDHVHGHTGANVYKGMVGLMPIYDPKPLILNGKDYGPTDFGDERYGLRLPGVKTDYGDGTFDVDYDIPLALYDCRLDDGLTPHKDAHNGNGESHPEWWGKTYFRHFPNHGFVGDIMTVNGAAFPVLRVKRRRYRLRFLDASISRIYNLQLMTSARGPVAARDLGYSGDELQGQYRLTDGQRWGTWHQIANEGGLLPKVVDRDSFELWPAKRKEFVVDFADGTSATQDTVLYLVNTMKMTTGRMWDSTDPKYQIPLIKIIVEGDGGAAAAADKSAPVDMLKKYSFPLRATPDYYFNNQVVDQKTAFSKINDSTIPTFELQRGSASDDPETEWLINGLQFEATKPMISVNRGSGTMWRIRNGGGGWVSDSRHWADDSAKEDVIALDPSETTVISRKFRTFTGPYVAHCHNLAHEDHNMMYGWEIVPEGAPTFKPRA